jgi:hypothetical protein
VVVWADGDARFHGSTARAAATTAATADLPKHQANSSSVLTAMSILRRYGCNGTLLDPDDRSLHPQPLAARYSDATNPFQAVDGVNNHYVLGSTLTALPVNTDVLQAITTSSFKRTLRCPRHRPAR